jgi:hypothetical protein
MSVHWSGGVGAVDAGGLRGGAAVCCCLGGGWPTHPCVLASAATLFMCVCVRICVFHFVWYAAVVPTEAELAEQTAILSDVVAQHGDGDLAAMYEHCRVVAPAGQSDAHASWSCF